MVYHIEYEGEKFSFNSYNWVNYGTISKKLAT